MSKNHNVPQTIHFLNIYHLSQSADYKRATVTQLCVHEQF